MLVSIIYVIVSAIAFVWAIRVQINSFGAEEASTELVGFLISFLLIVAVLGGAFLVI